jgi:preprotein translocase subunit SecE
VTKTLVATLPGGDNPPPIPVRRPRERTSVRQFFREVRDEMRQVAWPTRPEVLNYTSIVGTVLLLMIGLIFGLNYGCSKAVTWLFLR